ncbi:MAG TPA: hypothetical protein VFX02_11360 [Gammaproteobacteria bacterium]|nr:hypothetical protein [Gammaproteobacteria bacterium]
MEDQIIQQFGIGILLLVVGISGWLLPYKWNVLRLRRTFAQLVSEDTNMIIPKIVGTLLILGGLAILLVTFILGKFQ